MTISTYAELKTAISNWTDDAEIAYYLADFISLAESTLKHDEKTRFLAGEIRATASTVAASQYLAVPTGFQRIKRMHIVGSPQTNIDIVSRTVLDDHYSSSTGTPSYVAVVGDEFEFNRIPDSIYTVEIVSDKFTALSDSNTTNEIFPAYVDLYLYGALIHAAIFVKDTDLYTMAEREYSKAITNAKNADKSARYAGRLKARSRVVA